MREAARRSSCGNNLKQLGLALQNYHDARNTFPYASIFNGSPGYANGSPQMCAATGQGPNFVVAILPFIEGGNVITLYNKQAFYVDAIANISFRSTNLLFMLCPSDAYARPVNADNGSLMLGASAPYAASPDQRSRENGVA